MFLILESHKLNITNMSKHFVLSALALLFFLPLFSQIPVGVIVEGKLGTANSTPEKMMCNEAGTITIDPATHVGNSTDLDLDTIFLCFNDQILIDHDAGTEDLSGDPIPATQGGITYAIYRNRPTVDGPDLASVAADPAIIPNLLDPTTPFLVAASSIRSDDVLFFNTGIFQTQLNGGNPVLAWFAPITADNFVEQMFGTQTVFVPVYEGNPTPLGPCVDVNLDEAFAIVYLNAINANNIEVSATESCSGSFELAGGLPEFDNSSYNISIALLSDPTVLGVVNTPNAGEGDVVRVSVPQAGEYLITVSDGKSCPASFNMTFGSCTGVTFSLPDANIFVDGSRCIDVTVSDFVNVAGIQLALKWDPFPIRFDSIGNINPILRGGQGLDNFAFNIDNAQQGEISITWADFTTFQAITLPDDAVLFSLCFTARAPEGTCTDVIFNTQGIPEIRAEAPDGSAYGVTLENGAICISNAPLFLQTRFTDVFCAGDNTGSISFMVSDGLPPYLYTLEAPDGTVVASGNIATSGGGDTIVGLAGNTYTLVVTDSGNTGVINTATQSITISGGLLLGVNLQEAAPIRCFGESNGAIRAAINENGVNVPNPGPEYSFQWSTGDTTQIIRDVSAGTTYSVTVTKDGCARVGSGSISSAPRMLVDRNRLQKQDATCGDINDGFLSVPVTGGNPASGFYGFQWSVTGRDSVPSAQPIQLGGLVPGRYYLTVTDDNNCELLDSFDINALRFLETNATVSPITCFGGEDGEIVVNGVTVGTADPVTTYTFRWLTNLDANSLQNDTQNSSTIPNLEANSYIVNVEDQDGCMVTDTFLVTQPERIQLRASEVRDATCQGGLMDGRIELEEPVGGTAPYVYVWDSLPNVVDRIAENIGQGAYTVRITDANNCQDSLSFNITAPDLPVITNITNDTLNCNADTNGQLTVQFNRGSSNAAIDSIIWSNGSRTETTSPTLSPGVYSVRIVDTNRCFAEGTAEVIAPAPLQLDSLLTTRPTCVGDENGQVTLFVSGGTAPYTIFNGNTQVGVNAFVVAGLGAGTYNLRAQDANNCPDLELEVTITDPPRVVIEFSNVQAADCAEGQGRCTGSATAIAFLENGEQRTFDFEWENGENNQNTVSSIATTLCSGMNTLRVTDDGDCVTTAELEIESPPAIIPVGNARWVSCFGRTDGEASVQVLGGTPPYRYAWSTGAQTEVITGLAPDMYSVTIIDGNDCRSSSFSLIVGEPDSLIVTIDENRSTPNVKCSGDENGEIVLLISGGNGLGGFPFNWSNNAAELTDSIATDLAPGNYAVTVTDQNGCTDTVSYLISEPTPIEADIPTPDEPACFGDQTAISVAGAAGGNGTPYFFTVNNPNGIKVPVADGSLNVFGGQEHIIYVFDSRGCRYDTTIFINQPPPIEVSLPAEIEIQLGDSLRLQPTVFSTQPIDSVRWSPEDYLSSVDVLTPFIRPINSENYTLVVVDENGCTGSANVAIDVDKKRNVYIPNVFAPNSTFNSIFEVNTGAGVSKVNFIRIFDRWGELIFQIDEPLSPALGGVGGWDGRYNGQLVAMGTYVYIIEVEFQDQVTLLYRGDVTVIY